MPHRSRLITTGLVLTVLILSAVLLLPGIQSPLLLDDWGNLETLANFKTHSDYRWFNFLAETPGGGTGRLLSFITFIPQAADWPLHGDKLKQISVYIHLFNGLMVFLLARKLMDVYGNISKAAAQWLSLYIMLVWLIHPLFHSTVFYAIQRMALLGATFLLLNTLHGVYILEKLPDFSKAKVWLHICIAWTILLIGVFAKENAISGAFIISCMYFLTCDKRDSNSKLFLLMAGALPTIVFLVYLAFSYPANAFVLLRRDFTLQERLLTEGRVVLDYVSLSLFPRLPALGLFHDDFPLSRSLFQPFTTILAIFVHGFVIALAWKFRRRFKLLSFCVMAFYAAHFIESTFIPLEIYFEHRSYFPDVFLFLAISYAITKIALKYNFLFTLILVSLLYLARIIMACYLSVSIWNEPGTLTLFWSQEKPYAQRAQEQLISLYELWHKDEEIAETLPVLTQRFPNALNMRLYQIYFTCKQKRDTSPLWRELLTSDFHYRHDYQSLTTLRSISKKYLEPAGHCEGVTIDNIKAMTEKIGNSSKFSYPDAQHEVHLLLGELCADKGDLTCAMQEMDKAYDAVNEPSIPLVQTLWLVRAGLCKDAQEYQARYLQFFEKRPFRYRDVETTRALREALSACHEADRHAN